MKNTLIIVLLITLGVSVFMCDRKADQLKPPEVRDTTFVTVTSYDTITYDSVRWKTRYLTHYDTLTHEIDDTTFINIPIPISRHLFTDDTTYRAEVSGFGVTLDRMEVYQKTVYRDILITKIPRPKRWGLGVQVGFGINTSGEVKPYIGVGVSYDLFRF